MSSRSAASRVGESITALSKAGVQEKLDKREASRARGYTLLQAYEEEEKRRRKANPPPIDVEPFLVAQRSRSKLAVADMPRLRESTSLPKIADKLDKLGTRLDMLGAAMRGDGRGGAAAQMKTSASSPLPNVAAFKDKRVALQCTTRACVVTESGGATRTMTPEWGWSRGGTGHAAVDGAAAPLKPRHSRLRRGSFERQAGAALQDSSNTEQTTGARYVVGRQLDKLLPASTVLLRGLEKWPEAERLRVGFDEVIDSLKFVEAPQRWMDWPWGVQAKEPPRVIEKGDPPGKLQPPFKKTSTPSAMCIAWSGDAAADWEPPEHDDSWYAAQISAASGVATGYQLEVAEFNALFGRQPWRQVHKAKVSAGCDASITPIPRSVSRLFARVRGFNKFGRGEWSDEVMLAVPPHEAGAEIPITELPAAWVDVDLGGLAELKPDLPPAQLLAAKEALLRSLLDNMNVIKVAFTFYGLAGVNDVEDDPSTMSMLQFTNFATGARLLECRGLKSVSDLDLIFLRAARAPQSSQVSALAEAVESSGVAVVGRKRAKGLGLLKKGIAQVVEQNRPTANLLTQSQFVGALLRLAAQMYADSEPLAQRLTRLCLEHVSGHVYEELQLVKDDFDEKMRTREMGAALDMHGAALRAVFMAYSAADSTGDGTAQGRKAACAALDTMNVRELNELCEDCQLFDSSFTTMNLLTVFCKVNITDDLFEQEAKENTSSELMFDEFEEVLARIFNFAVYLPMVNSGASARLLDKDGDGDLDEDDIDALFDECDQDGSGSITVDELAAALKKRLNAGAAYLVAKKLVRIADEDGEGSLTREELKKAVRKLSSGDADDEDEELSLERAFYDWLGTVFLPTAAAAAKQKKLASVAAKMKAAVVSRGAKV